MSTPSNYFAVATELEAIKAMAFELLMSDEIGSIDGPNAARLADHVFDMSHTQAADAIAEFEASR